MAISPATGVWSIAKGPDADRAAMNDCLAKAQPLGATDCAVAIADNVRRTVDRPSRQRS